MAWVGLAVQAVVFAVWAWQAMRSLFRLHARAVERAGNAFPGLSATLEAFGAWITDPQFAADRRRLALVTAALVVTMVINRMVWVQQ